jgi:hypothetical protein
MKFGSWKKNLGLVLPELRRVAIGGNDVKIVVLSERIALGLPKDRKLAGKVVNLYRPMKWKARMVARALKVFVKLGGAFLLGSRRAEAVKAEISWLSDEASAGFLGCNPAHGLRCVVLSRKDNDSLKVTKLAIGGNLDPIIAEGECLKEISGKYPGVPHFGGSEEGEGWAAFWTSHIEGCGPQELMGSEVIELLEGWLHPDAVKIGDISWLRALGSKAHGSVGERLREMVIRGALVHGDFTPWNLRRNEAGLVAIDWEWARRDGVGGLDLGHGLVMDAILVKGLRGLNLVEALVQQVESGVEADYLGICGWSDLHLWLMLSLLYAHQTTGVGIEEELNVLKNRLEHSQLV